MSNHSHHGSARRPSLRKNVAALYVTQVFTYVVPLLTLPWLTRILEPEGFGKLAFATAICSYCSLLSDYGFNLSATRAVAIHIDDLKKRSEIFWNTLAVKTLLAAGAFCLLGLSSFIVPRLAGERSLLAISYLLVAGSVLTPLWYFQGLERQPTLSRITIVVRACSIPLIYWMVRTKADLLRAAGIAGAVPFLTGLICIVVLFKEGELLPAAVSRATIVETLRDGWHLFVSSSSASLYTTSNTVLLGFIAGNAAVGSYSAAEKLTQVALSGLSPLNQSFFPRISRQIHESPREAFVLIRKLLWIQGIATALLSCGLLLFAPIVINILYGKQFQSAVPVLRWLSPLPFLIGLSNVFGIQTMVPLGMKREFTRILLTAGAFNVVTLSVLAAHFQAIGAAISVLMAEVFVTLAMAQLLQSRKIPVFQS